MEVIERCDPYRGMNPLHLRVCPLEDRAFDRAFGSKDEKSEHARNGLMSAVIGRKVIHSEVRKTVLEEQADGQKRPVADFICTLEDGTVVAIEVQRAKGGDDLGKRLVFYMCRICSGNLGKGKAYGELPAVYQVVILVKGVLFPGERKCVNFGELRFKDGTPFLTQVLHMVTIELEKLEKDDTLSCALRDWLIYLKKGWKDAAVAAVLGNRTEGIREAEEICMKLSSRLDYLEEVRQDMHERDRELALRRAREEDAKYFSKVLLKGKKQGLSQGRSEGLAKGEKRAMRQVVRNMKSSGMPVSQIAQFCGLSEEEVLKL